MSCLKIIKDKGLRLTTRRRLIIDIIHRAHSHLTGEDIIKLVQTRMPGVNKSTIYRTLGVLERAGCVFKSMHEDRFIYYHAGESHHYHMICSKCGTVVECREDLFTPVEDLILKNHGFYVDFKHNVINGFCGQCKNRSS